MVVVMRCEDTEPAVPSNVVICHKCLKECWLSKYSGQQTVSLAILTGDARITCSHCFFDMGYTL